MVTSLRHLAVLKLTKVKKYDGEDTMIEDVIFEADQNRHRLEDELARHQKVKPVRTSVTFDMNEYYNLIDAISVQLFDEFTYEDMVATPEHVLWKEYFHTLYEFTVVDTRESFHVLASTVKYHDEIEKPQMVAPGDSCYSTIMYLLHLFEDLKHEQLEFVNALNPKIDFEQNVEFGRRLLEWTEQLYRIRDELDVYDKIVEWSMK